MSRRETEYAMLSRPMAEKDDRAPTLDEMLAEIPLARTGGGH